jgi:hypothetical protein
MSRATAAALAFLLAAACAPSSSTRGSITTTGAPGVGTGEPSVSAGLPVRSLPSGPCSGVGAAPSSPEITFISGSLVYQVHPDGSGLKCLVSSERPLTLAWSAAADRLLLGGLQAFTPDQQRGTVPQQVRSPRWSRPTGKSTIYISIDRRHLLKVPAAGGKPLDISFLDRHDEVTYHPAGTHIAVSGKAKDGSYGIFLATNTGGNPVALALSENAREISGLAFSHQGDDLYFSADHGDHFDLHRLNIRSSNLETVDSGSLPYAKTVTSEFGDGAVAYRLGSCSQGTKTMVWRPGAGAAPQEVASPTGFSEPAGWMPDGSLLLIARPGGCDGPGDLLVWHGSGDLQLVAHDASRAAPRAVLPAPPEPPLPGAGAA